MHKIYTKNVHSRTKKLNFFLLKYIFQLIKTYCMYCHKCYWKLMKYVSYDDLDKLVLIMNTTFYSLHNNLSSFWFSFSITVLLFAFCWIFTENIF